MREPGSGDEEKWDQEEDEEGQGGIEEADKAREEHPSGRPSEGWVPNRSEWLAGPSDVYHYRPRLGQKTEGWRRRRSRKTVALFTCFLPGARTIFVFVLRVRDSLSKWKQKKKFKKKLKQPSSPPQAPISAAGVDRTSRYNLEC